MVVDRKRLDALVRESFSYSELRSLFRTELNEPLDEITSPTKNFAEVVFDVLEWCVRHWRAADFVRAAVRLRDRHPEWRRLGWELDGELADPDPRLPGEVALHVHVHGRGLVFRPVPAFVSGEQTLRISGLGIRVEYDPQ